MRSGLELAGMRSKDEKLFYMIGGQNGDMRLEFIEGGWMNEGGRRRRKLERGEILREKTEKRLRRAMRKGMRV